MKLNVSLPVHRALSVSLLCTNLTVVRRSAYEIASSNSKRSYSRTWAWMFTVDIYLHHCESNMIWHQNVPTTDWNRAVERTWQMNNLFKLLCFSNVSWWYYNVTYPELSYCPDMFSRSQIWYFTRASLLVKAHAAREGGYDNFPYFIKHRK